ncbi:18396_t:CDS:2 [Dentiscutata erythropus]|uniref:18396_t:CDS:1 n=1 Tax=Dentiscutata erythropus TaxID=1348616 RepID=A0A9N9JGY7_9GLOM|nr:18396_t:CDS:2 [Dentiscutata erythropus]
MTTSTKSYQDKRHEDISTKEEKGDQEQKDECNDIPILDDGEIVEDVKNVFIKKRKCGNDENDEEEPLHEKQSDKYN